VLVVCFVMASRSVNDDLGELAAMNRLCETFRALAFDTHSHLARCQRLDHQPLEETYTDINLLELKDRNPGEIFVHSFTKRKEGANGADWEWWITNPTRSLWLGLRVQAKVQNLKKLEFSHLHYKKGSPPAYQLDKLEREALKDGLFPLYCLYTYGVSPGRANPCRSFGYEAEAYGCSLISTTDVRKLRGQSEACDLASVSGHAIPWHCLVCCSGFARGDLPTRALAFLNSRKLWPYDSENHQFRLRDSAPQHVLLAIEGREPEDNASRSAGVLIIAPREG
jgi:hypothetical protein